MVKSKGNMYDWVTHMHTHLGGECGHKCSYCYLNGKGFGKVRAEKYTGPIRLLENEFNVNYGNGKTIFIEHCNDLFADNVPDEFIERILAHCCKFPDNTYVFQSKNVGRMFDFRLKLPKNSICGTTIETNRDMSDISKAPDAYARQTAIRGLGVWVEHTFVTVEPILKFDKYDFATLLIDCDAEFVNIGADSKENGLEEPTYDEIMELYELLQCGEVLVKKKINLERLKEK
jgi:DNA repair photolyase